VDTKRSPANPVRKEAGFRALRALGAVPCSTALGDSIQTGSRRSTVLTKGAETVRLNLPAPESIKPIVLGFFASSAAGEDGANSKQPCARTKAPTKSPTSISNLVRCTAVEAFQPYLLSFPGIPFILQEY
jgi:hypothetical protein